MDAEFPRAWIRLRVLRRPDGYICFRCVDFTGWSLDAPSRTREPPDALFSQHVAGVGDARLAGFMPRSLIARIEALQTLLPVARTGSGHPVELPIFVDAGPGVPWVAAAELLDDWLRLREVAPVAVVLWAPQILDPRSFALPLKVLSVGRFGANVIDQLGPFRSWLRDDGLPQAALETRWVEDTEGWHANVTPDFIPHVILLDAWDAARMPPETSVDSQAALAIVGGDPEAGGWTNSPLPEASVARSALLVMDTPMGWSDAAGVLDGLSHDLPLHESVHAMQLGSPARRLREVVLVTNEVATHDLRLTSAAAALVTEGREYSRRYGVGWADSKSESKQRAVARVVHQLEWDFGRETTGLWPLAHARSVLDTAPREYATVADDLSDEGEQRRVVDLAIRHAPPAGAEGLVHFVKKGVCLLDGSRYLLDISIGAGWVDSIVEGTPPPIDALLPPSQDDRIINATVVGRGITIEGPSGAELRLPAVGSSDPVSFAFRVRPGATRVWARVSLHHKNRLLQTFMISSTVVSDNHETYSETGLKAELQHNETVDWSNLARLPGRDISILVNQGQPGSHQIVVNRDGATHDADFAGPAQEAAADRIRDILRPLDTPAKAQGNDAALRQLAYAGEALHRALFSRLNEDGRAAIRELLDTADRIVQVVRIDENQILPWASIYDWDMPDPDELIATPVCFGTREDGPCGHSSSSGVVCIRGFWGVRHRIEEIIGIRRDENIDPCIAVRGNAPLVGISIGTANRYTKEIPRTLKATKDGKTYASLGPATGLLELLWDQQKRPGVIVLVGHHERKNDYSRVQSATKEKWLRERDIYQRSKRADWPRPGPLLLLIACDSAAASATDLNAFVLTLSATGATGVVGTEVEIKSDAAQMFSIAFLTALTDASAGAPINLAEAMHAARQAFALDKEDIRAFAFTAFGTADAHVVRK
ncbi:MAG: CHAT domain-containing protein [bacterium]|nr:CHAT domain-containing protein [bacterium]